jgi:pyridinium-3,5-biscarboxylic acid mononucleotide synthase
MLDQAKLIELLHEVQGGKVSPADAVSKIRWSPFENLEGVAAVDHHRKLRCGFPEVIFGQGKAAEHILNILEVQLKHGDSCLVTRVSPEVGHFLSQNFARGEYNALGRTFRIPPLEDPGPKLGKVVVVTAGTSDLPVAEEARVTAEAWNCEVDLMADVGVAGIHRLLSRLHRFENADAVVAVAGMEGALPSVLGGLTDCPVIAVPTSIGYGAHLHGLAPLLTMLNSCASNVVCVNIDSGFNGGHMAGLIARRAGLARAYGDQRRQSAATQEASHAHH